MRVLFFYSHPFVPTNGGIERVTDIISNLLINKFDCEIFYLCGKSRSRDIQVIGQIEQNTLPCDGLFSSPENIDYFVSFIKKNAIDIVVSQSGMWSYMDPILGLAGAKYISVIHSTPLAEYIETKYNYFTYSHTINGYIKHLLKMLLYPIYGKYLLKCCLAKIKNHYRCLVENSDVVVVLSSKYVAELEDLASKHTNKITYINNPNTFSLKQIDFSIKEKIILYVGRLEKTLKCPIELLKIWRTLHEDYKDWRLIFIGEGDARDDMESYISRYQLQRVTLEGKKSNVEDYYEKASIISLVSRCEGWGMVLTEGMGRACVPICYNSYGAAEDIIDDGLNGFLIQNGNRKAYSNTLRYMLDNPDKLYKMALAAHQKVEKFSADNIVEQWFELLTTVKNDLAL